MSEEETDEGEMSEEESEEDETEQSKSKGKFWLIVLGGLIVIGIGAYFIFHHPAAPKPSINNLPSMVGGC